MCEGEGKGTSRESIRREATANEIQMCNAVHLVRTRGLALCKTHVQSVRSSMSSGPFLESALALAIVFLLLQFSFTFLFLGACLSSQSGCVCLFLHHEPFLCLSFLSSFLLLLPSCLLMVGK